MNPDDTSSLQMTTIPWANDPQGGSDLLLDLSTAGPVLAALRGDGPIPFPAAPDPPADPGAPAIPSSAAARADRTTATRHERATPADAEAGGLRVAQRWVNPPAPRSRPPASPSRRRAGRGSARTHPGTASASPRPTMRGESTGVRPTPVLQPGGARRLDVLDPVGVAPVGQRELEAAGPAEGVDGRAVVGAAPPAAVLDDGEAGQPPRDNRVTWFVARLLNRASERGSGTPHSYPGRRLGGTPSGELQQRRHVDGLQRARLDPVQDRGQRG